MEWGLLIPILGISVAIIAIVSRRVVQVLEMRHRERMVHGDLANEDMARWARTAERLEERLKVLESILDDEVPGWRRKYDD